MKFFVFAFMLLAFQAKVFAAQAMAASLIKVPVPRSEIQFPKEESPEGYKPLQFRLGMTTWKPSSLTAPSRLLNTSEYRATTNANLKFEIGKEIYRGTWFSSQLFLGFTYIELERTGQLNYGSTVVQEAESLNVFQFPLALEMLGNPLLENYDIRPLFKLSVIPMYSRSSSGTFTKGVSELNWLGASALGFSTGLSKNWKLAAGLEASQSLNSDSDFSGKGFWLSVGMDLN
ncbi:MAG: hypothetical protein ACXVCP_19190 [Bdellovibrio sp.]